MLTRITWVILLLASMCEPLKAKEIGIDREVLGEKIVRSRYPINDTRFGNIDQKLYKYLNDKGDLSFKSDFDEVDKGIKYLTQLAKYGGIRGENCLTHTETSALLHLLLIGINLFKGENGLPKRPEYGLELLKLYAQYRHPLYQRETQELFKKISRNLKEYDSSRFLNDLAQVIADTQLKSSPHPSSIFLIPWRYNRVT